MDYRLRVVDCTTGQTIGSIEGPDASGAFDIGDEYVIRNPYKDYIVIDDRTGSRVPRSRIINRDEEIRRFAESEVGGNI